MFKATFESFKENIQQKTTNPFLGTLLIVWVIHNWKLVFSLFNLDEDSNLDRKLEIISIYMEPWTFTKDILWCALISLGVLTATYFLLGAGRFLANLYDDVVIPWLQEKTNINKVVLKERYDGALKYIEEMENKLSEEKAKRKETELKLEQLEAQNKEPIPVPGPDKHSENENADDSVTQSLAEEIQKMGKVKKFWETIETISSSQPLYTNDSFVRFLSGRGIIKARGAGPSAHYLITEEGNKLRIFMIKKGIVA